MNPHPEALRLYDTRTRVVAPLVPVLPGEVRIYVCGLTPSAEAHLGHARSFVTFDVLRRVLVHRGYRVTYVRNVTDVDDRSIAEGARRGVPFSAVVDEHFASFTRSMTRLGVLPPDREPRATAYVPEIVAMIAELTAAGHAYAAPDGVYFSVRTFPRYGRLSGRDVDELLVGARIAPDEGKRDPLDFALWKTAKPGEPAWPSPWGDGRPGWHIECSAMAHALLGEPIDVHGGGYDLVFPHHENEIAQSEAVTGVRLADHWVHGGLVLFDGRKMSKSLGNFEPLAALLDRHDPQAIRLLFLQTGYRKPVNFTEEALAAAASGLRRLFAAYDALRAAPVAGTSADRSAVAAFGGRFHAALADDLNTAKALGALFDLAAARDELETAGAAPAAAAFLHEAFNLLGIPPAARAATALPPEPRAVPERVRAGLPALVRAHASGTTDAAADGAEAIDALLSARTAAKRGRDFATADAVRGGLAALGVAITDAKDGTSVWSIER